MNQINRMKVFYILLCIQFANIVNAYCVSDPSNKGDQVNKRFYLETDFKANYFKATEFCRAHGMQLVSINSQEEQDRIETYIKDAGHWNTLFWTSGSDLSHEGTYVWMSTGKPFTYRNWTPNEPNNAGDAEDCICLWNRDGNGMKWNDGQCSTPEFFICEEIISNNLLDILLSA